MNRLFLLLLLPLGLFAQPQSPNFVLIRESFSANAARDTTANYILRSIVGQTSDAGVAASPNYIVKAGYLAPVFESRIPVMVINRDTVNFGDVWRNASVEDVVVVLNAGNADLVIDSVHSGHPLLASVTTPQTIPAGQSINVSLSLAPPDTLTYAGYLTAYSNGGTDSVYVRVHGIWTELRAEPAAIDFGTIAVGDSIDSTLTLRSVGNAPLQVESVDLVNGFFSLLGQPLETIGAYGSAQRVVRFRAVSSGVFLDTLELANNAGQAVRVPLTAGATAADDQIEVPHAFALEQNYPNPFNASTRIRFAVPRQSDVQIEAFNVIGRRVATLLSANLPAGYHDVDWNCAGCPSGLYFVRMAAADFVATRKVLLLK